MKKTILIGLLLSGCSTAPIVEQSIPRPDPAYMLSCSTEKPSFKEGMDIVDIARDVVQFEKKMKEDCSYLNEKKKAYIESLFIKN